MSGGRTEDKGLDPPSPLPWVLRSLTHSTYTYSSTPGYLCVPTPFSSSLACLAIHSSQRIVEKRPTPQRGMKRRHGPTNH